MPKAAGAHRCAGRPTRLAPWLFFLLFALLGGAFYFGGIPDLNPPAPSAVNPVSVASDALRFTASRGQTLFAVYNDRRFW